MPKKVEAPKPQFTWRIAVRIVVWLIMFAGVAWCGRQVNAFLLSDPRFGLETLEIHGTVYANRARIRGVFEPDFGKSVFHLPLAERRRHLLAVDWVLEQPW